MNRKIFNFPTFLTCSSEAFLILLQIALCQQHMLIQRPSGPTAEKFRRSFWEERLGPKGRLEGIRVHRFSISRSRDIKAKTKTRNRGLASQSREKGYFS